MAIERDYERILKKQMGNLEGEVNRQTEEYKEEKGKTGGKILDYMYQKGLTEKLVKTGVIGLAGLVLVGPTTAAVAGGIYLGKRLVYDPLFKKKK